MKTLKIGGLLLTLVCLIASKVMLEKRRAILAAAINGPDLEPVQVSYRADSLKKLSFGFESFISSLLWIRLLQDAKTTPLKSNQLSWEFSEVDAVTSLDPNFDAAYPFGSLYVSFFRRDKEGGKRILQKWVKKRPIYWKPHHMLGMHYFLELNDSASAAPHILRASQLAGAPQYISSLGIGLLGQAGATQFALQSAIELFEVAPSLVAKMRLAGRIRSLRWKSQKDAWSNALAAFQKAYPGRTPSTLEDLKRFLVNSPLREVSSTLPNSQSPELKALLSETFSFQLGPNGRSIEAKDPNLAKALNHIGVYLEEGSK